MPQTIQTVSTIIKYIIIIAKTFEYCSYAYCVCVCVYFIQSFSGTATAGNITLTNHSITYEFRVSAAIMYGQTLNEGDLSTVTASTTVFVPEPGKSIDYMCLYIQSAGIYAVFLCVICLGLPTPSDVRIMGFTNSSISLTWDYPPPPSEAIQSFLVLKSYYSILHVNCPFLYAGLLLSSCGVQEPPRCSSYF